MDHEEAMRISAVEKYLLGELGEDERAEFEEHFFGCPECAEELKLTEAFLAGARKVLPEPVAAPAPERRPSRWPALVWPVRAATALAMAALVGVVLHQRSELSAALAPQPASFYFLSVSRGEAQATAVSKSKRLVGLTLGEPPGPPLPSYRCEVRDAGGRVVWSFVVPAPPRGREIEIAIPASELRPGAYTVVLGSPGEPGFELARYPFTVQIGED
jgi:putative zinc finger protein